MQYCIKPQTPYIMENPKIKDINPDLSVGEVLRTDNEWWSNIPGLVTTENLKEGYILLSKESGFRGMVGEHISIYSYALINTANLEITPIRSVKDYKNHVYPRQFKKGRIATWIAIRNGILFGESGDPSTLIQ